MNIDEMVPSKSHFLTKEDVGEAGKNLTIKGFTMKEVGFENDKEMKYVIEWMDTNYKPMVLNKENASRLKFILQTSETTSMVGRTVNVYNDRFVKFGNEMKGGLRIRPIEHAAAQTARPSTQRPSSAPVRDEDPPWQDSPPLDAYSDEH